ncbi:hypothetical protein P775_16525 [Puniceibacterium antarcticum]|uniref:PIG-L family deacetylase n=1 Tax=Puniceibacterium antarcticum TaxID=1206336 RepID=A0A2G8RBX9_9RHOB|nr:PIG-L family deacetylase [Puniceibacterium antarcticum]PIL19047.1 hypothetical protein P775_16525 [Puniceibacterium antarcticum]
MNAHFRAACFDALSSGTPIVILAPHPDDESLGCGGLLAEGFRQHGAHVICVTDRSASHPNSKEWPPERLALRRRQEFETAIAQLGGKPADTTWLGLKDSQLHAYDPCQIATDIESIVARIGARCVFAPATEDHHADHKTTARIARTLVLLDPDLTLYSYPVWCRWDDRDFATNIQKHDPVHFDIARHRARKAAAIRAHESQLGSCITDDPDGFRLDPRFVAKFIDEDEIFWRTPI